jgi:hydrogenase maturation protein HypF
MTRRRFTFRGTVQGVGFRPSVYRLAVSLQLSGFVQNRRSEVVAEVQGDEDKVSRFASELAASLPPAAIMSASPIWMER